MKQKVLFLMLLLLLGLAGGSVMAGEPVVERQAGMKIKPGNGIRPARLDRKELARQKGMRLDGKELDRMEKMPLKEASAGMKQRKDAPKRQAPPLIKEQPEGELTTYWRSGGCISGSSWYEQKGKLDVVIDGTDAYIKNPSWYEDSYNTWVSGTYDAETGIISIPTGQYLYWNETKGYGIQMMWGSTSGYKNEGSESYSLKAELDENVTEILFQIDEEAETITLLDSEGNLGAGRLLEPGKPGNGIHYGLVALDVLPGELRDPVPDVVLFLELRRGRDPAGKEAAGHGGEGDNGDAVPEAEGEDILLAAAFEHVVEVLDCGERVDRMGPGHGFAGNGGEPPAADEALFGKPAHLEGHVLDRYVGVHAVEVVDVHPVRPQALQGIGEMPAQGRAKRAVPFWLAACHEELGGEDDVFLAKHLQLLRRLSRILASRTRLRTQPIVCRRGIRKLLLQMPDAVFARLHLQFELLGPLFELVGPLGLLLELLALFDHHVEQFEPFHST